MYYREVALPDDFPTAGDFSVPEHLVGALAEVDQLYATIVAPLEESLAHRFAGVDDYLDTDGRLHPEIWEARRHIMRASGAAGLYGAFLPSRIGGRDYDREDMLWVEERVYSYGLRLNPALLSWSEGATPRVIFAHDHHRDEFTLPLVRGEKTAFHAITEPGAGSNLFDLKTNAVQRNGDWVLNGHKAYITNAFEADVAQVLAVTHPGNGRRSFTYFQFDTHEARARGFSTGKVYQTMFNDGITGEVMFDDLVLPADSVIGEVGGAFDIAMASINWTRMRRGGMCSGWGQLLIHRMVERAKSRVIGGTPLGANQGIAWMVADSYADWMMARSLSLSVAKELDHPGPWWKTPRPREEIRKISAVKLTNDECFYRIADRALQLHGAAGVMRDTEINKLFQLARNFRIPGGADEVQRNSIAEGLGLRF